MFKGFLPKLLAILSLYLLLPVNTVLAQKDWRDGNQSVNPNSGYCVQTVTVRGGIFGADGNAGGTYDDIATIQGVECLFYNVLQVIVYFAGLAFFIMFINGGYQYLFSSNDPKKVAVAQNTLSMAVLGLVGVIGSWLILRFIHQFTGVDVLKFIIPSRYS